MLSLSQSPTNQIVPSLSPCNLISSSYSLGSQASSDSSLAAVVLGHDAVEWLAAGARRESPHTNADDVGVLGLVVHDLDLAPDVLVLPAAT